MTDAVVRQRHMAKLAADAAAGWSCFVAENERDSVVALDAARQLFRNQVEGPLGRVIDMAGNPGLAVFEKHEGTIRLLAVTYSPLSDASRRASESEFESPTA